MALVKAQLNGLIELNHVRVKIFFDTSRINNDNFIEKIKISTSTVFFRFDSK